MYKPASTKSIITTGFASIFVMMLAVVWLSLATLQAVNNRMSVLIKDTEQKTSTAYQMRDAIRQRAAEVRTLLQVNNPTEREKSLARLVEQTKTYNIGRERLTRFGADTRETVILEKVNLADNRVSRVYDRLNELLYSMTSAPDELKTELQQIQLQELVLLNHLNDLVEMEKTIATEQLETNQEQYQKIRRALIIISLIALILGIIISVIVTNRVSRANARIEHLASHDDLTGLINRREFEDRLEQAIASAQRDSRSFGLMYLDMDRFKIVNDTCGHHAGDKLLIELTSLIRSRLRKSDVLARIGGDEFAVIASADSFDSVVNLAEDLRLLVSDYVFTYANQNFKVSLSIGVIPIRGDITDLETVLSNVDSACYVAKQSGRNRIHVAWKNDIELVKYRNDIAGIQIIRQALSDDRLVLYYQPVFKILDDGVAVEHCEILLRIKAENGELYSPSEFIPLAEKYNIMNEIDRWVVAHVFDWIRRHQFDFHVPKLLINLSGLSFINNEFLEYSINQLQHGGIDPHNIAFEITETAAVDNLSLARNFMQRLKALGCQFALDDFGSGFSTFAYLKQLPIDYLKIDGSLVRDLANDNVDKEMVKAINEIGHTVGAKTIAEFVESDEILDELRKMGVDYAQGFALQRPRELRFLIEDLGIERHKKAS